MELDDTCTQCHSTVHFKMVRLTWQGGYHNHEGGFLIFCCTLNVLTPDISPNLGNLTALFLVVGYYIHEFFYMYCLFLFIIYI